MKCKQCSKEFDNAPIKAWGNLITPVRCKDCRKLNSKINEPNKRSTYPAHPRDHTYNPNPGGYCIACNWGRDHS